MPLAEGDDVAMFGAGYDAQGASFLCEIMERFGIAVGADKGLLKVINGHGLTHQKALNLVASLTFEESQLLRCFDTFGTDAHVEAMAQFDDGAHDGFGARSSAYAAHKGLIDLDFVEGKTHQVTQA